MNKLTLFAAAMALMIVSCVKDEVNESTFNMQCGNLVSSVMDPEEIAVSDGLYSVKVNFTESLVDVTMSNLEVGGEKLNLVLKDMAAKTIAVNGTQVFTFSSQAPKVSNGSTYITDFKGELPMSHYFETLKVPGVTESYGPGLTPLLSYVVDGKYQVKTFSKYPYFGGVTKTSYTDKNGVPAIYENKTMTYHLVMDLKKLTADVVIYRAKFAEPAPSLQGILLRGLKLEFSATGYKVKGENIVPEVIGDGGSTPNERFMFDYFSLFSSSANMSDVKCTYNVAGMYHGSFQGSIIP